MNVTSRVFIGEEQHFVLSIWHLAKSVHPHFREMDIPNISLLTDLLWF